ncbi:hypothetical protein HY643_01750 [Candidatus Woesearchaeota archaeon]|nr:hypothetical protein [Candidatus Woesearchaeota archaeon]
MVYPIISAAGLALATTLATPNPSLELQTVTQEKKLQLTEQNIELTKRFSVFDYNKTLDVATSDSKLSYNEIKDLYEIGISIINNDRAIQDDYKAYTANLESKVDSYFKSLKNGEAPKIKISNEDLFLYFYVKTNTKNDDGSLTKISVETNVYRDYLNNANFWLEKDFVKKNKYWFVHLLARDEQRLKPTKSSVQDVLAQQRGMKNLEILDMESQFPVKYRFKFPTESKASIFWGTFGLLFPPIRNVLFTYLLRRESATARTYFGNSVLGGIFNGLTGVLLLDGIHPLVYPIRMFATPFIIQPIRKALCGDRDFIE